MDRRGSKRLLEDYVDDPSTPAHEVDRAGWHGAHLPPHIRSTGLSNLGSNHFTLTPDFATRFPHLASVVAASERLGLTGGAFEPIPSYLPPSQAAQSHLLPQNLLQQSNVPSPLNDHRISPYGVLPSASGSSQLPQPSAGFPQYAPPVGSRGESHILQRSEYVPLHSTLDADADAPLFAPPFSKRIPTAQRRFSPARSKSYEHQKGLLPDNASEKFTEEHSSIIKKIENPVEGMIFGCNNKTKQECKKLQLFGLPSSHKQQVLRVIPGSKLFLFNYESKHLTGVFEATCCGAMDILPDAFKHFGSFPAQVKIKRTMKVPSITMDKLKIAIPEIFHNGRKFKYELTHSQVEKLLELFVAAKDEPAKKMPIQKVDFD